MITSKYGSTSFVNEDIRSVWLHHDMTLEALKQTTQNTNSPLDKKVVTDVYHRYPISIVGDCPQYRTCKLEDNEDVQTMFSITAEYPNLIFVNLYASMDNTRLEHIQSQSHPSDWDVMEKYLDQAMKLE